MLGHLFKPIACTTCTNKANINFPYIHIIKLEIPKKITLTYNDVKERVWIKVGKKENKRKEQVDKESTKYQDLREKMRLQEHASKTQIH